MKKKEKQKKVIEFTVPTWSLGALINDDFTGLSDEEEKTVKDFMDEIIKKYGNAHFILPPEEEREYDEFKKTNDMTDLAGSTEKIYLFDESSENE